MLIISREIQIPESELKFQFARSSGPGGQNVNKVNSKAQLRWDIHQSAAIPEEVKARFVANFPGQVSADGVVGLQSDRHRDRLRNQQDCLDKLRAMLLTALVPPKKRKKTKPTRASRERRLGGKRMQSEKKRGRGARGWD